MQLMHVYVQKSTRTTRRCARSCARVSGRSPGVLNQRWVPVSSGASPRRGSPDSGPRTTGRPSPPGSVVSAGGPATAVAAPESKRGAPRRSRSRDSTAADCSSGAVGLTRTSGRPSAIAVWKRTSRSAAIAAAVRTRTTPTPRWSAAPNPRARTASVMRRPPRRKARSTAAVPVAYPTAIATVDPLAALTAITAARTGPAQGGVEQPERGAGEQPAPDAVTRPRAGVGDEAREPGRAGGDGVRERRDEDDETEGEERADRERPGEPDPEAHTVDDLGEADDRHRERDDETRDDAERPAAPAGRPGGEERREDREHARAERGPRPGEDGDEREEEHRPQSPRRSLARG